MSALSFVSTSNFKGWMAPTEGYFKWVEIGTERKW